MKTFCSVLLIALCVSVRAQSADAPNSKTLGQIQLGSGGVKIFYNPSAWRYSPAKTPPKANFESFGIFISKRNPLLRGSIRTESPTQSPPFNGSASDELKSVCAQLSDFHLDPGKLVVKNRIIVIDSAAICEVTQTSTQQTWMQYVFFSLPPNSANLKTVKHYSHYLNLNYPNSISKEASADISELIHGMRWTHTGR